MKHVAGDGFWEAFSALPLEIQKQARAKFELFAEDPHHPSLRTRKMPGKPGIWEGHVSHKYVFTFRYVTIAGETAIESLDIGNHDEVYDRA
jgi:mRNA-degrading endonuclease YafQ of YafQ-DinJ toxin-antitoxin module